MNHPDLSDGLGQVHLLCLEPDFILHVSRKPQDSLIQALRVCVQQLFIKLNLGLFIHILHYTVAAL